MPKIRVYQNQVSSRGNFAAPDNFSSAGAVGAGVQVLGKTLGQVMDQRQVLHDRNDIADVTAAMAKARAEWTVKLNNEYSKHQPGDLTFQEKIDQDLGDYLDNLSENARTDAGRRTFETLSATLRGDMNAKAGLLQAKQSAEKAVNDYNVTLDAHGNALLNDPGQYQSILAESMVSLHNPEGAYAHMTADKRALLERNTRVKLATSAIQGDIYDNPQKAKRDLEAGVWDKAIETKQKAALLAKAEQAIKAQESESTRSLQHARALKLEADRKLSDQFLQRMAEGDLSNDEILRSSLDFNVKEHFLTLNKTRAFNLTDNWPSEPKVVNLLQRQVYLPDTDPNKITDPNQINAWYNQKQISFDDLQLLRGKVLEEQKHSPFGRDQHAAAKVAHSMFLRSAVGSAMPDVAEEAWYNWNKAFEEEIKAARERGDDPRELLDSSSKKYWLSAGRIGAFMRTAQEQVMGMRNAASAPPEVGQIVEHNGVKAKFLGGDPAKKESWEELK